MTVTGFCYTIFQVEEVSSILTLFFFFFKSSMVLCFVIFFCIYQNNYVCVANYINWFLNAKQSAFPSWNISHMVMMNIIKAGDPCCQLMGLSSLKEHSSSAPVCQSMRRISSYNFSFVVIYNSKLVWYQLLFLAKIWSLFS